MVLWLVASSSALLLLVAVGLAFPWILYGFHRPANREEAIANGREMLADARRVVAIGAHPDDLECDAGGTLAKLARGGTEIIAIVSADGGSRQAVRRKEEQTAAKVLGYREVIFLGHTDGALSKVPRADLTAELKDILDKYRPDTVLTFDPVHENWLYKHPDHLAVAKAAVAAADQAGVEHIYLFFTGRPNTVVDISDGIDRKLDGWMAFESQHRAFPPFAARYFFGTAAKVEGSKVGYGRAESFRRLR